MSKSTNLTGNATLDNAIDTVVDRFAHIMQVALVEKIRAMGKDPRKLDVTHACEVMSAECKVALFKALDDAKQAKEANMNQVASATVHASAVAAGIRCASLVRFEA